METLTFEGRTGENNFLSAFFDKERTLVERFTTSPEFDPQRKLLEKAVLALSDPTNDAYLIESSMAGFIFEHIAFIHLNNLLGQKNLAARRQKFLLSPDEVTEVFSRIYGVSSIENRLVLQRIIKGVTMPDGLEFTECPNTLQLTGIWDAKLGDSINSNSNQRKSYRDGVVQRTLRLESPEGRTRFGEIISELRPDTPDKPFVVWPGLKVASYLYPIDSKLPGMGFPGEKVPISRLTIQGLKEMFIRKGTINLNNEVA